MKFDTTRLYPLMNCLVLVLALSLLYGCSAASKVAGPSRQLSVPTSAIVLTPSAIQIQPGAEQQYSATLGGTQSAVNWSVNGLLHGNEIVGTIDANGLYRAPINPYGTGVVNVEATSITQPSLTASARVTIASQEVSVVGPSLPRPITVSVTPAKITLEEGHDQQFMATVQGTSNSTVIWSLKGSPPGSTPLGMIDQNGVYTAPTDSNNPISVVVVATSAADSGRSGTAIVTVELPAIESKTSNYYVNAEDGNDNYDGTAAKHSGDGAVGPWRTLRKAGLTVSAGATVHVADGTYKIDGTIGSESSIETRNSGLPNQWITYVSDNKWGAKITNTNGVNAPNNVAWVVEGDYQIVKDFDISGGPSTGIFVDANHVKLIGNHLHDISSAICLPGSFIYVNSPYQYVDTIGNVLHDGGMRPWPSDCGLWHGIYYGGVTAGPVQYGQISNNIIYRVSGWGIHFWHKVSHIDVLNNLIFANVHGGILIGASDSSTNDYFNVINNVVIYNSNMINNTGGPASLGWGISEYISGGEIGSHNNYIDNLVYANHSSNGWGGNWAKQAVEKDPSGIISGNLTADPLLTNYQNSPSYPTTSNNKIVFSSGDYRPTSGSPAKNTGDCAVTPPTDIDGAARPQEEICNIGPY